MAPQALSEASVKYGGDIPSIDGGIPRRCEKIDIDELLLTFAAVHVPHMHV